MGDTVEFATDNGQQMIFYKITSSAINFEVKALRNAAIGLSKNIGPDCDYLIALGDNDHSWIRKAGNHYREKTETPNILSMQEYRRFWVSWNGKAIRLGGEGHSNPIVSFKNFTKDLKYITFFVLNEEDEYQSTVHWRVEFPPIIEKTDIKPLRDGELYWVPVDENTNALPDGAVLGGYEKGNVYIIRAAHRRSLTPGKFSTAEGTAYISWGWESHVKNEYEVLCGYNCIWVPCTTDTIPGGAIVGGYSENIEREKLYIGRAKHLNYLIPGKVQQSHNVCFIAYGDKEIGVHNFEILVNPEKKRSANTILVPPCDVNVNESDMEENDVDNAGLLNVDDV